jgi:lipopolysaccharide export system protein LptC
MAMPGKFSWRDGLSSSLPLVLMGLLAAGTWWLVRHTPQPDAPRRAAAPAHEVDYQMSRFEARRYGSDGTQRAVVSGDVMRHYADDGSVEIDAVRARGTDNDGRRIHATALRGISNADNSELRLLGQAHVVRDPVNAEAGASQAVATSSRKTSDGRTELLGEALWLYPNEQRVRSDIAVTLLSETGRIDAGSLDYDGRSGVAQLGHGVRGQYAAPPQAAPQAKPR